MGFKRSEKRMRDIEVKLRAGMTRNGIAPEAQEQIIESIVSFALYGFPESHSASFALLAYASAYLKTHYLAAFTAALLNNQPMGFYHPSTIVKDAQRHGLKVLPINVTKSDWGCTLEQIEHPPQRHRDTEKIGSSAHRFIRSSLHYQQIGSSPTIPDGADREVAVVAGDLRFAVKHSRISSIQHAGEQHAPCSMPHAPND